MLKDVRGDWRTWQPIPVIALCATLPAALFPGQAATLLPVAAASSGLHLWLCGSRSNHIMQDLIINAAIVLAAVVGPGNAADFSRRLGAAVHRFLVVLYAVSALHKLNSDWFDTQVSCASSVTATLLAQYGPAWLKGRFREVLWRSPVATFVLETSPGAAAAFEVILPALLAAAGPPGFCRRLGVSLGAVFHLMLALPLPPASFYPFSASCLALYAPDAVSNFCLVAERVAPFLGRLLWFALPGLLAATTAAADSSGSWSTWVKQGDGSDAPFEPYDLYNGAIYWCFLVTALWLLLCLCGPGSADKGGERPARGGALASVFVVLAVLTLGLGPYLGTRTYPAFAMFSNLRIEGGAPNHQFLGTGLDLFGFQADVVHVDLSQLYTHRTSAFFAAAGLLPALWICPPSWRYPPAANFTAFSAPAAGLYQRLKTQDPGAWVARVRRGSEEFVVSRREDLKPQCRPGVPPELCLVLAEHVVGPYRSRPARAPLSFGWFSATSAAAIPVNIPHPTEEAGAVHNRAFQHWGWALLNEIWQAWRDRDFRRGHCRFGKYWNPTRVTSLRR
eukprot:s371_g14.t1